MAKLSEQEIPDLKTQLASITEKLEKLTNKIEEVCIEKSVNPVLYAEAK